MDNFDHILLFKTNIESEDCINNLKEVLNSFEAILAWNIDLDDCDYVLRIVSYTLNHQEVIKLINSQGYKCCELT